MRVFTFVLICIALVASCSSCCKKKETSGVEEDYKDFELVDENRFPVEPDNETTYHIKLQVIRRSYFI